MRIALITTHPELEENNRIKDEAEALGHAFELVDLNQFTFKTKGNNLDVKGFTNIDTDVVIVRGILRSVMPIAVAINNLRNRGIKIFDNNFLEHKYSIDKVTDLVKLSLNGILIPDTGYSRDFGNYKSLASEIGYPVVVKQTRTGKGLGVFKVENEGELDKLVNGFIKEGKDERGYLLQKYILYKHDLRCLVIGDKTFTMKRIPAEGEFRANFSLGGSVEVFDLDDESKQLALDALRVIGMSIGGVDILDSGDTRYILEVNHIPGFVGMEKATGENIGKLYVEHAINNAR